LGLIAVLLGIACAGGASKPMAPAAPPIPAIPVASPTGAAGAVFAVPMNPSGGIPPACRLPAGVDGAPCVDTGTRVPLSPVQIGLLESVLDDPTTWGGDEGKCVLPLHGFVWVDADGALRRQVAVSLLCDKVEGAPAVPGQPADPVARGLSAAGVLALRALCVDVGLPHCHITQPGEAFGR